MVGYERIPAEFKAEMPALENKKFDFTDYSWNDIVQSTEKRAFKAIERAGGNVTATEVRIRLQTPRAPKLEQWSPGVPSRRIHSSDPDWTFQGNWQTSTNARPIQGAGGEASLRFEGVALVIVGAASEKGGCAEGYLDGKKQKQQLNAYAPLRTRDNVLWSVYGLKPGSHTLRLVSVDASAPQSQGKYLVIEQAVVYRHP